MRIERLRPDILEPDPGVLRVATFRWILREVIKPPAGAKIVDLGAGHCRFSQIASRMGYTPTAVDVRDQRLPENLGDIEFIKSDIRAYDPVGFDVILILGLLYHLTLEDQIGLLSRCPASSTVVIDTQVHIPELVVAAANRDGFADRIVDDGPYSGVLYPESDNPMASWGNTHSLWHTEPSLFKLLENSGRNYVRTIDPPYVSQYGARNWFIAVAE